MKKILLFSLLVFALAGLLSTFFTEYRTRTLKGDAMSEAFYAPSPVEKDLLTRIENLEKEIVEMKCEKSGGEIIYSKYFYGSFWCKIGDKSYEPDGSNLIYTNTETNTI